MGQIGKAFGAAVIAGLAAGGALAQDYPDRPIEMIVTFGPGGGSDVMGRTMARLMEETLGVPVPVSNVGGASGNAGLAQLRTNPADGYTVGTLVSLTVASWASGLGDNAPEDYEVLAVVQSSPSFLFVPASSPHQSAEALFAFARENPGAITVATSGYGTQDDVTLKLLADAGIQMENVPLQAPAERYASPIGGHTSAIYEEPGDVAQFIEGGQLVPVVVFAAERHPAFPDVPTSAELGIDIAGLDNYRSVAVAAGTPPERVAILTEAVAAATASEEWTAFCEATYTCITPVTGPEAQAMVGDFRDLIAAQLREMIRPAIRGRDRQAGRRAAAASPSGLRALLPTAVPALLLAAALILPGQMFQSEQTAAPIGLGPAAWPVAALALLAVFAALWIARDLWALRDPARAPTLSPPVEEERYRFGHAVAGLGLIVLYGWVLSKVGFALATAIFIFAWCWLGGMRRPAVVMAVSLIGTFAILWLFMGLALMPLPRGLGPFDGFSVWLLRAVGIY